MVENPSRMEAAFTLTGGSCLVSVAGAPHPAIVATRSTAAALMRTVTHRILAATRGAVEEARPFLGKGLRREDLGAAPGRSGWAWPVRSGAAWPVRGP
ncbi:hypothetical protein GCM10010140_59460 [Streptosporangium pseudovulgare]|uniref:Uncharacterized protein n=1 Tax=Streptosporangium pseudovulgare TaxID=35765 RepID=A0ABQ2R9Z0_9ACTN|nr:hypothetical protein GCM10010140_59460 [Streptosporangium pseudovulgare]